MNIYIDKDMSEDALIRLLEKAGHSVQSARGANLLGRSDAVQFTNAIHEARACLTANYGDYEELHLLLKEANGNHPGILVVRQDNDPSRDVTAKGIVTAIRKLESAGVPIANEYTILSHWR
jgi:GTP-sensing pleiotropic transcriptional regulator CodY